jgi:hypothetical protein
MGESEDSEATVSWPFTCEIQASGYDLKQVEIAIADIDDTDLSIHERTPFHSDNESSVWQTLIIMASSGTAIAALRSVIVELIRSRHIRITINMSGLPVFYEGPLTSSKKIRELADAVAISTTQTGSESKPVSPVTGDAESIDGNS